MTWWLYAIAGLGVCVGLVVMAVALVSVARDADESLDELFARRRTRPQQSPGAVIRR